jgi:hypothetical protein
VCVGVKVDVLAFNLIELKGYNLELTHAVRGSVSRPVHKTHHKE